MDTANFAGDFSYLYFQRLVEAMKTQYVPCRFGDAPARLNEPARPLVFLRHDVDVSLERALEMGFLEQELRMPATYMILTRADLYDLRHPSTSRCLRELQKCGHEIGLHFDIEAEGVAPDAAPEELERALVNARDTLADLLGGPISSFSFHRPVARFLRGPLMVAGMVNAYAAELMPAYISDSKALWRSGEPLPRVSAPPSTDVLQVLIHPIWWAYRHQSGPERLQSFFEEVTAGEPPESIDAYSKAFVRAVPSVSRAGAIPPADA